ncbi:MAG: hypothetical protein JW965_05040 [Bacteroidales bacterium]|nr:hypothetical protein [Bacteroidales bacterium]
MRITILLTLVLFTFFTSCSNGPSDNFNEASLSGNTDNNLLFDNEDTQLLVSTDSIRIFGEVVEEQYVSLGELQLRSVIVKEVLPEEGQRVFKGTFRYDGYSLEDLLGDIELEKKSGFDPITDLYVKVHSSDSSYSVISWAEIFFPVHHNLQIIATRVARHVPVKTPEVQYALPSESRLVVSNDLLTCRNISNPVSIEICSCQGEFPEEEMDELYWPTLSIVGFGDEDIILEELPDNLTKRESDMIFYGRGRGIHAVNPFEGKYLSEFLELYITPDAESLRTGIITASAPDGYRSAFSLSEIMNRNDRLETLIMDTNNYERAGRFSLIVSGDFFSDRAMKALSRLVLIKE